MWLALSGVCAAVLSLAAVYLYLDPQVPKAETYRQVRLETPLRVYTADRQLIAEFGERRLIPITLDQVPDLFVSALLDTEDKRFFKHHGIDYISLLNDSIDLLLYREIRSGASTITMQLARNISFSLEQTFIRKFKEMLLALKIERELSKDEILALYINVVAFGKRAYGAQAAALTYYGRPLKELNLAQLAMLAGIPQAPTAGNPINGPDRAVRRRNLVLSRMLDQKSITVEQFHAAVAAPVTARIYQRELDVAAPYPAEWVRQQLLRRIPDLYSGGYEVITTLDSNLQRTAKNAVRKGLVSYDRRHGYRGAEANLGQLTDDEYLVALREYRAYVDLEPAVVVSAAEDHAMALLPSGTRARIDLDAMKWARPYIDVNTRGARPRAATDVVSIGDVIRLREEVYEDEESAQESRLVLTQAPAIEGALISINPNTGAVRALVGGYDFALNQFNHALQAARQPGSGFKPFVYAGALQHGVTPASIYMDAPLVFEDQNLESDYRPDNDNNLYNGPTRLREALYRSINLVSMRVLLDVGAAEILDYAARFGFDTSRFPRNTQLAIGGGTMAVTPIEMVRAYSVFANGGWRVTPHIISRVLDLNGETVFEPRYPEVCPDCPEQGAESASVMDPNAKADSQRAEEPGSLQELLASEPASETTLAEGAIPAEEPAALPAERAIDERIAYIMTSMLKDVVRRGTGTRARSLKREDLAGKTGTTNEAADTWFNGFNPTIVTTVWVGFPDHTPLGRREYGSNNPLPIWIEYMQAALRDQPEQTASLPAGVVTMKIDPKTGEVATPTQRDAIFEYFLKEHAPKLKPSSRRQPDVPEDDFTPADIF